MAKDEEPSKAHKALLALLDRFDPRFISREEAVAKGLGAEFTLALRAGLIQSAGYETTVAADDWLNDNGHRYS